MPVMLPPERCRQSLSDHVFGHADDRDSACYRLKCSQGGRRTGDDRIGRGIDQTRRTLGQIIVGRLKARDDNEVLSLDKAIESQFVEERLDRRCLSCGGEQEAEPVDTTIFLRSRSERPRRCAAEQRDELAPLHSITSSARPSSGNGMERPSALAVLRLTAISSFVSCCTGRSAGLLPLRMRPAYSPTRRNASRLLAP
jgi:hypothetical protein